MESTLSEVLVHIENKQTALYISQLANTDVTIVPTLIEIIKKDAGRESNRAAWVLSVVNEQKKPLVEPFYNALCHICIKTDSTSVRGSLLRILSKDYLDDANLELLLDPCFDWLVSNSQLLSVRVYSMEIAWQAVQKYPELAIELKNILELGMENGSAGYRSRASKILKGMQKIKPPFYSH